ncbi:MAG: MBL fold metallo-hydrolase [Deltaproteobacteria bacterium]|nr:MBL fold metallo-hydrolase [Deltaproteobacteria bacterium]
MPRRILLVILAVQIGGFAMAQTGAPRDGDRFVNLAGPRPQAGASMMLPFLLGKVWGSLTGSPAATPHVPFDVDAMRHNPSVTWIGHSTFLVRMDGVSFLTDPIFSERASPVSFAGPARVVAPGVPLEALPRLDFALVSHDHYDHFDLASITALARRGVPVFVPLGLGALVREAGGQAIELDWWESRQIGRVTVHCVPAQHFSGRTLTDGDRTLWSGWVVTGPSRRFYHAGDTGYFDGFRDIGARLGPIDLAAIPIGAYDPSAIMQFVHMNPEEAVQAAVDARAATVVGMHWGTFNLTEEPMDEPPRRFHAEISRRAMDGIAGWTLAVGETRRW